MCTAWQAAAGASAAADGGATDVDGIVWLVASV